MKLKLLIGLALLGSLGVAHAESTAELQSRCGNDAAAFLDRYKRDQADPHHCGFTDTTKCKPPQYDYENHYSESIKGCFIVIKEDSSSTGQSESDGHNYSYHYTRYRLFDVNAHRELGEFSKTRTDDPAYKPGNPSYDEEGLRPMYCDFNGVDCSGEAEWQAKVQPYVPGWKG